MKFIRVSCFFVLAALHFSGHAQAIPAHMEWTNENVSGLAMSLEDPANPTAIENFRFAKSGYVLAEFGKKGGWVTAPAFRWKVVEGRLQLGEGKEAEQFTLLSRNAAKIVVSTRSGKTQTFKIIAW